ncbi:MAG: hypothetical protein IJ365_00410, partial [Clostridia bacterium]|nr:hypothetical protein [Clostridia bacterium]
STVAIRASGDGMYTVEWNDGSSWITTDVTEYNLKNGATIRFLVKNQTTTDMYVGNHLVQADIPQRYSQHFTKLGFDLGNSMTGSFTLDNIVVTTDTTIETLPEPEPDPDLPENSVSTTDTPTVGAPTVAKEDFDLYLAIGQSNMAGRASLEKEDKISLPNTYLLNADDNWETAQAQYVDGKWCGFNRYSTVRKTEAAQGLSPAFYFAKTVSESVGAEGKKIGIISNARGDTSIEAWQKGFTHDSKDFDLYEEAVRRAKIAMESGTLKGIIWHQGCANISSTPASYIEKFQTLVNDLRTDLGVADLPIIIGEIPGFGDTSAKIESRMNFNKNCIAQIPSYVDNCYAVSSAGSRDIGDKTHFDNASQKCMGTLYGECALEKIYGYPKAELNTVPLRNISGNSSALKAAEGVADIHSWADSESYWSASAGDSFSADFAQPVTVKEIKSYFRNPYNYVAQYKIYLINGDSRTLVSDNSAITSYPYIGADGAVVDDIEDTYAEGIVVEITGGADIDGASVADIIGCHEFEVRTADAISATSVSFYGYSGSADISIQDADKLTVKADSADGIEKIDVYFNDVLETTLTEAPYEIDISTLGVSATDIRVVAQSYSGDTAEASLELNISSRFLASIFEDSTLEIDASGKTASGIATYSQRGYVKT